ncbi:MAG: DUF2336 domain-containing protein [Alphaproteobacteria bacterium]|nr:DUF2336 domain-containing protein [Alphaproteobacteria bacterium]
MSPINDKLPTMLALAREHTELSRVQLAGMLADIFLAPDATLSLREEEMVNELIDQLMLNSTPKVRAQLVEKFVDLTRMPRRVASNLAQDNSISIAGPILLASPNLTDQDLINVVTDHGSDHALAVASRQKISEAVADALVTTGDVRVMQVVAENLGAHLSRNAVDVVADAARYAIELREPLLRRPEMNAEAAVKLYWWVEQDLRRYALKRFGITSGQIDQALASTIGSFLDDHVHQKANDEVMQQVAQWMEDHNAVNTAVLPQVLRMGHFRLFNMLIARLAGLNLSLIDTIMSEAGGRGLASICRAVEIDKPGFVSLFLLARGGRPGDQVVHPRELSHALSTFDRMSPAIAKDLLHSWSVNPDYFAKHREESAREDHLFL